MDDTPITLDPLTAVSLYCQPLLTTGAKGISHASGFIAQKNDNYYFITNWHVVTGKNALTKKPLSPIGVNPDVLLIYFHSKERLGSWKTGEIKLRDDQTPLWREHPNGSAVDLVALPIPVKEDLAYYPIDLALADIDLIVSPSEPLSIIGFPQGKAVTGKFPIWKTGHLASDMALNYNNTPSFLVDATTRGGMSGAPVVARRSGMYRSKDGNIIGHATRFMGVYSGRILDQESEESSEIGIVWKPKAIQEILDQIQA